MDPQVIPVQPVPVTFHTTMLLPGPVAENWTWPCGLTWVLEGEIVSFGTATTMTVAAPDCAGSATDVAVTVTDAGDGPDAGAVYSPVPEIAPQVAPLHPAPETFQVTAVFVVPLTWAENCCCAPVET